MIKEKKVWHKRANVVIEELVQVAFLYKHEDNGQNPKNSQPDDKDVEIFLVLGA